MDNSKIWLISDCHFNHRNIIKYCNRPFSSVEEMNATLIENWNSIVNNNDRVFMLGDFCLSGKDKIIEIGNQLKGRKTLIMGNHDSGALSTYYEAGFEMVSKYPIFLNGFLLSHYPLPDPRFINIHGHIHNTSIEEVDYLRLDANPELKDLYVNVSCDVMKFKPIALDEIKKFVLSIK